MTSISAITFGDVLRRQRLAAGFTQDELAQRANLSLRAISDLERGVRNRPWRDTIQRLAAALGLELAERDELDAARRYPGTPSSSEFSADNSRPGPRTYRHNLPAPLTSFIGRERERVEVRELLASTRQLTLTGAGGVGKTRLALQVARDVMDSYADGVWLVEVAALADSDLLPSTVATCLGIREESAQPALPALLGALQSRQSLIVLDNCEHLLGACADLARTLLQTCPDLTILATSRERLGTPGEFTWRVPSLATTSIEAHPSVEVVLDSPALRLFVERARAVESRFELTPENTATLVDICRRLDGIPLAIELAAARVRTLAPAEIAERLDDRFGLLVGSDRGGTPRHATLRAAVEWSHDLLDEGERMVFRRLAVFAGGWSLEAAEAVCTDNGIAASDILDRLTSLADKSLVIVEDGAVQTRYHFLETIRAYALERLVESGEYPSTGARHAAYYLKLADAQVLLRMSSAVLDVTLANLDRERDNERVALRWFDECNDVPAGVQLIAAMCDLWRQNGPLTEGRVWLERFWSKPDFAQVSPEVRARALHAELDLNIRHDPEATRASGEKLLKLGLGDSNLTWQETGLNYLAWASLELGEISRAEGELAKRLALNRELGLTKRASHTLILLGDAARIRGDDDLARERYQESRDLSVVDDPAWQLRCLGFLAVHRGELVLAATLFRDGLSIARNLSNILDNIECLGGFASLYAARGEGIRAARLLGTIDAGLKVIGVKLYFGDRFERARTLATLRGLLSETELAAAAAEGQAMTLDQAIGLALEENVK